MCYAESDLQMQEAAERMNGTTNKALLTCAASNQCRRYDRKMALDKWATMEIICHMIMIIIHAVHAYNGRVGLFAHCLLRFCIHFDLINSLFMCKVILLRFRLGQQTHSQREISLSSFYLLFWLRWLLFVDFFCCAVRASIWTSIVCCGRRSICCGPEKNENNTQTTVIMVTIKHFHWTWNDGILLFTLS